MSWNVLVGIEQEDHDMVIRGMILTRASAGITNTAIVGKGDVISFSGIELEVTRLIHKHQPLGSKVAPVSLVLCGTKQLFDNEIDVLVSHGFEDA